MHGSQSIFIQEETRLTKPIIHSINLIGHKGAVRNQERRIKRQLWTSKDK